MWQHELEEEFDFAIVRLLELVQNRKAGLRGGTMPVLGIEEF
jgi:hypothetical protein